MDWLIPVAGVFIGWVTNIIAVEMLFSPKKPMFLFGFKIPFTPGLIPQNKSRMLDVASYRVSSVVIDTLADSGKTESYKLFSKLIDSHWATHLFIGERSKKKLYNSITKNAINNDEFKQLLNDVIRKQMSKYSIEELEGTVKKLSNESLQGIKMLGAIIGGLVGIVTMLIGGI